MNYYIFFFFFFFQAEDGIRDKLVTGVQTCALPISARAASHGRRSSSPSAARFAWARTEYAGRRALAPSSSDVIGTTSAATPASSKTRRAKPCQLGWPALVRGERG